MPHFILFFKTETLRNRLAPCLAEIPACFSFDIKTDTPLTVMISETDPLWQDFPFPVHAGDAYIFDDVTPRPGTSGGPVLCEPRSASGPKTTTRCSCSASGTNCSTR